ncbi:MAG: PKD domain-containing protein [Actinomycetota bacterium]
MISTRRKWGARIGVAGCLVGSLLTSVATAPPAAAANLTASLVRTVLLSELTPPSPDPSGIAWDPAQGRLIIADSEVEEMAIYDDVNLWEIDLGGNVVGTGDVTTPAPGFSNEPTGLSFDPGTGTLFVSDDFRDSIFQVKAGLDGAFGTDDDELGPTLNLVPFGSTDTEDVAFDTGAGDLFASDGANREVYHVSPGANGVFDGAPPDGDDTATNFDLAQFGAVNVEGLGYDPVRDTLLVVDSNTRKIYETTTDGALVNTIDFSAISPRVRHAEDVVIAPSLSDPGAPNMYLVARGVDNNSNPNENDGKMYELTVSPGPIGNLPPVVDAGPNLSVSMPGPATLVGSVTDDDLPSGSTVTSSWSQLPGAPGTATFADPTSPTTDVTFSAPGTYVLRLTADDTALQASDEVEVTVSPVGAAVLDIPVERGSDDAEETISGSVLRGNGDLELATDATPQTVGLRFTGVSIPQGATILGAHVQFRSDETSSSDVTVTIEGEAADAPGTFKKTAFDISTRPRTGAAVAWTPDPWTAIGEHGSAQQTSDLSPVIQELVDLPGWGATLVLIVTGDGIGRRTAESFNSGGAPVLHVEYMT